MSIKLIVALRKSNPAVPASLRHCWDCRHCCPARPSWAALVSSSPGSVTCLLWYRRVLLHHLWSDLSLSFSSDKSVWALPLSSVRRLFSVLACLPASRTDRLVVVGILSRDNKKIICRLHNRLQLLPQDVLLHLSDLHPVDWSEVRSML